MYADCPVHSRFAAWPYEALVAMRPALPVTADWTVERVITTAPILKGARDEAKLVARSILETASLS